MAVQLMLVLMTCSRLRKTPMGVPTPCATVLEARLEFRLLTDISVDMTVGRAPNIPSMHLSQVGYEHLYNSIISGRLRPGDEIPRREIASRLGVSLAPINEAVARLEAEGFVEVSPRRQTRVRVIQKQEVRGLLILREAIECQAARLYCGAPVAANINVLSAAAQAVDATTPGSRENELAEIAFHTALVNLVNCELLSHEFTNIMRRRLFYKINAVMPWPHQPALDNHRRLLRKLQIEDPDEAAATMRRHLERGREAILQ
jgi:DNA-binding GntR family transcriptional regulator